MKNRNERGDGFVVLGVAFALLIVGLIIYGVVAALHVAHPKGCEVIDKDRTSNDGKSDMRIYTENCGNFKVDDSWLSKTWHSSDTYRDIDVGKTYDFTTRGYRVEFFSWFPNIVEANEVK